MWMSVSRTEAAQHIEIALFASHPQSSPPLPTLLTHSQFLLSAQLGSTTGLLASINANPWYLQAESYPLRS